MCNLLNRIRQGAIMEPKRTRARENRRPCSFHRGNCDGSWWKGEAQLNQSLCTVRVAAVVVAVP
jgi:hypothetical protein